MKGKRIVTLLLMLSIVGSAIGNDTIEIKGKLLYIDEMNCLASSMAPMGTTKLLLVKVKKGWDTCKKHVILVWQVRCDCYLNLNRTYTFKVIKYESENQINLSERGIKVDFCDNFVTKLPRNYYLEVYSVDEFFYARKGLGKCIKYKRPLID